MTIPTADPAPFPPVASADPVRGAAFLAELRETLPELRLLTDPADTESYRWDETEYMHPGHPLGVVFPGTTADVSAIVKLAAKHRVPLVPRGAGTGVSGGAIAVDGALSVVMIGMAAVLEVDTENLTVTCQPGILNAELGRHVAQFGLFYPPDPASYEICSIGGNLAENSGGLRCVKYGVTRDYVLGLTVVLADGAVIQTGGKNVKDVMGYDLTRLFVGSEGTLGIITEAILRLIPMPAPKLTMLAFFRTVREAGRAVAAMTRTLRPATLELMDRPTIQAVDAALRLGLDSDAGAMLMIESDAGGQAADQEMSIAEAACAEAGATSIIRANDPIEADWLREARRKAHWSLEQVGVARMEDVGVARSRIPDLMDAITEITGQLGVRVGVFGHAGDGNFHPTFVMEREDERAEEKVNAVRAELFKRVLEMGGTVSGEHGTGVAKKAYLEAQRGPDAVRAMRSIKAAMDPLGILNPGKIFA